MGLDVEYSYDAEYDVTNAIISDSAGGHVTVGPSEMDGRHTALHLHAPDGVMVEKHLTEEELDEVIAQCQRSKAGCFEGEWPRPSVNWAEQQQAIADLDDFMSALATLLSGPCDHGAESVVYDQDDDGEYELLAIGEAAGEPSTTRYVYDPEEEDPDELKNRVHVVVPLTVEDVIEMVRDKKANDIIELHVRK
jgi:hypothetical protein